MYDRAKIFIKSGDGGDGRASFRREKFVAMGGPDGGDGGRGGDVIFRTDTNITDLLAFKYKKEFKAEKGGNGGSSKCSGKNGADMIISVPIGTMIYEESFDGNRDFLVDLDSENEEYIAIKGGDGGQGNIHFATSTNQAPRLAQAGAYGQEKNIFLELKIIADAAIIGFPNAGKSSLLTESTNAEPKIAPYPFTTLSPKLGIVELGKDRFVLAEIPGLIKDAHQGKGLGHDFLRHIQRNRVLIHLIDGSQEDPLGAMLAVNNELALYDPDILLKPQLVVLNKEDMLDEKRREELEEIFREAGVKIRFISAGLGVGVKELMEEVNTLVKEQINKPNYIPEETVKTLRPQDKTQGELISIEDGVYVIHNQNLERFVRGTDTQDSESRRQLRLLLTRRHIVDALVELGAQEGDSVRCANFTFKL